MTAEPRDLADAARITSWSDFDDVLSAIEGRSLFGADQPATAWSTSHTPRRTVGSVYRRSFDPAPATKRVWISRAERKRRAELRAHGIFLKPGPKKKLCSATETKPFARRRIALTFRSALAPSPAK